MYKQIKFRVTDSSIGDHNEILGGIGIFNDENNLVEVICGCCGGTLEPCDIEIIEVYKNWMDLSETIIGDDKEEEDE